MMKKTIVITGLICFLAVTASGQKKSPWTIDGKRNFISAKPIAMNFSPMDIPYQPTMGGSISYTRVLGFKRELEFNVLKSTSEHRFPNDDDFELIEPGKSKQTTASLIIKKYFVKSGKNFAPIGTYWCYGAGLNWFNFEMPLIVEKENNQQLEIRSYETISTPSLILGFGRNFRVSKDIFMGFGLKTNLLTFKDLEYALTPDKYGYSRYMQFDLSNRMSFGNLLLAEYSVAYLF